MNDLSFISLMSGLIKGRTSRQYIRSLLVQGGGMILVFILTFVFVRLLGATDYGRFAFLFSWVSVIATIAVAGVPLWLTKELAASEDPAAHHQMLRWSMRRVGIVSSVTTILAAIIVSFLYHLNDPVLPLFYLALSCIPAYAMMLLAQSALRGKGLIVPGQSPERLFRPLIVLMACLVISLMTAIPFTVTIAVGLNILAFLGASILSLFFVNRSFGLFRKIDLPDVRLPGKRWGVFTSLVALNSMVALFNARADILMLGWLSSDHSVGLFNVAARLSDLVAFPLMILIPVLNPLVSKLFHRQETGRLKRLLGMTSSLTSLMSLGILAVLILSGSMILSFFGAEFVTALPVLYLLGSVHLLNVACGPVGNILTMCGHIRYAFTAQLAGTVVNLLLNAILIPVYDIVGAAVATASGMVVWNVVSVIFVRNKTGLNPTFTAIFRK